MIRRRVRTEVSDKESEHRDEGRWGRHGGRMGPARQDLSLENAQELCRAPVSLLSPHACGIATTRVDEIIYNRASRAINILRTRPSSQLPASAATIAELTAEPTILSLKPSALPQTK